MAPIIWGLDLNEMKWSKFKSSYMWNTDYHLRRSKFIVYQLALIFCVFSESLGTAALSDYVDQQTFVEKHNANAGEYNDDYIGAASFNIFSGIFTATIFGAAFFFDLFWPERQEIKSVRTAWKVTGVLAVIFMFANALTLTIITATKAAYITGVSTAEAQRLVAEFPKSGTPLEYYKNGRAIAAVVFVWPGFCCTVASCVILFYSLRHDETFGSPFSTHARTQRGLSNAVDPEAGTARASTETDAKTNKESYEMPNRDPEAGMMGMGQDAEKNGV